MTIENYPTNYAQEQLNIFYGPSYLTRDISMDDYEMSGYNLPQLFNPGDHNIHVNCGNNPFKGMVPNFRAQDPTNPNADYIMPIDEYANVHKTSKFNNAIILNGFDTYPAGSLDYWVTVIASLMFKRDSRIFWRTAINNTYPWTFDEHIRLAATINYSVIGMVMETETDIYAEWTSNIKSTDYSLG
jgi:hypothetical protein